MTWTVTSEHHAALLAALCPEAKAQHEEWLKWRRMQDIVTSHPDYRFNGKPKAKRLLLNLARFNMQMMAHFNDQTWRIDGKAKGKPGY